MSVPSCSRHIVHCNASDLHAGQGYVRSVRLDHLREQGGALVCAEGEEEAATLAATATNLWCIDDRIFVYDAAAQSVRRLSDGRVYPASEEVLRMVNLPETEGGDGIFALCAGLLYRYENSDSTATVFSPAPSVTNLVLHHERLFGASGTQIRYTAPMKFESWKTFSEQGAGRCDLLPAGGDVVDVIAMRDRVFFLRQCGITRLTGYADVYNFKLDDVPFGMGKIVSHAAVIGECAYFFTESGLCRFDGSSAGRAEGADDGEIDLTQPMRVERAWGTALAASVTLTDGSAALYLYEPAFGRGRFVRRAFVQFSAADSVVLMRAGKAYRLTGRALPEGGSCSCTAEFSLSALGDGEKRLEAVYLSGAGSVRVEAFGPDGVRRACEGEAGGWLDLAAGVRGETVTVRISSDDEEICVREIALRIRREGRV